MRSVALVLVAASVLADPAISQRAGAGERPEVSVRDESEAAQGRRNHRDSEYGVRFASCLANYKRREAEAWLATAPGTPASEAAYRALIPHRENRCVQVGAVTFGGTGLNIVERNLRGLLAQTLYLNRFRDEPPTIVDGGAEDTVEAYVGRVRGAADMETEIIRIFGECMATRNAAAVDRMLRTSVGSDEESEAIGALGPDMEPCLWNGQSIAFSRESLRAALADGRYRTVIAVSSVEASQ